MARKQTFRSAQWSEAFRERYASLQQDQKKGADKVIIALIKDEITGGMRVKPIHPDKYYCEARINDGDRLIFRESENTIWFIDIVVHDDIARYSNKPRSP